MSSSYKKKLELLAEVRSGNAYKVDLLLKNGCHINKAVCMHTEQGYGRWNPLCYAVYYGNRSLVAYLINKGAKLNAQGWTSDQGIKEHFTPLFLACKGNHLSIIMELVNAGANVNGQLLDREIEEEEGGSISYNDVQNTYLHWAAQHQRIQVMKTLLHCGADPNILNGFDETPLHVACDYYHPQTVEILIHHGALSNNSNQAGLSPLVYLLRTDLKQADTGDRQASIQTLIQGGYDIQRDVCWRRFILTNCGKTDIVNHFMVQLCNLTKNPMKLLHLCRACIRKQLHSFSSSVFMSLPLSDPMKFYLSLQS